MSYTPPAGNAVALALAGAYTVPAGNAVVLALRDPGPPLPAVPHYTRCGAAAAWGVPPRAQRASRVPLSTSPRVQRGTATAWTHAPLRGAAATVRWGKNASMQHAATAAWSMPPTAQTSVRLPWGRLARAAAGAALPWSMPPRCAAANEIPWAAPPQRLVEVALPWSMPPQSRQSGGLPWTAPPQRAGRWRVPWGYAPRAPWVVHGPGVDPPEPPEPPHYTPPEGNHVRLALACPQLSNISPHVAVPLGPAACYFAWPRPRTYIVLNTAQVVRLPERTPIGVHSVQIRGSAEDVVWSFALQLTDPTHLALLLADGDGPKVVEINVNGYVWTAIIESYSKDRQFPGRSVSVSGRSQTALLDAPYAPPRAKVQTADRQAQQLIDEELDLTGFTATYDTLTWLVPGGVWHYDSKTPLAAARDVAAAAGAVVQSHAWDKVIRVAPRYAVSPWDWPMTAPDKQIQDDIILRDASRVASKPLYDYVLVSGEQVGVSDPIIRQGSAGEIRATMVVDPLITTHAVALERGRNVLSDRGEQALVDVLIPLFPPSAPSQPGLVLPLHLVEVVEPAAWKALAVAVAIDVQTNSDGALIVDQTVTLERHYSDAN